MAAQLWTRPQHENKTMDPELALDIAELLTQLEHSLSRCECGGERAKTPHSRWCPKYK